MSPRREDPGFLPNVLAERAAARARAGSAALREVGPDEVARSGWSRRDFLRVGAAAGGGLFVAVHLAGCAVEDGGTEAASDVPATHGTPAPGEGFRPNAWVEIHPDGTATITVSKSEMGQGVRTTLALMVAEELDLDWDRVRVRTAPADEDTFGDQGTGGSASVQTSWFRLREAGAAARAVLVTAAAAELGV
ncbi:MAG: molybdopterin-dependent oxidoreductase, partial [Gemmatimonadota bacterium]